MTLGRPSAPLKHPKCDFGENAVNYYRYCCENDLFLTHALATPKWTAASSPRTSSDWPWRKSWPCMW